MKRIVLLIILSVLFIHSYSSTLPGPVIKGIVVEKGTNTPIEFADVILSKKGETTAVAHSFSETNGQFTFSDTNEGEYVLLIRLVGYDIYNAPVIINQSSETLDLGKIELAPLEVGLSEVVIEAQKRQVIYKLDKKIIDASNNLMSSGGTAVDILENMPSIRIDAEGEVTFRGSSGFRVYVDGKPSLYNGTLALQQVPSGQIDNIEIITVPSARHDTEGDVGIINIITKKNSQHGFSGMVNMTGSTALSNGVDFMFTKQNKNLQWYWAGSWSQPIRKSDFDQNKKTIVGDLTTVSHSNGPRQSKAYNYYIRNGYVYTGLPNTTLNIEAEIGYGKKTRKGDLDYTEEQSKNGSIVESGHYMSRDFYDLHQNYYQGSTGFSHRFDKDGHELTGRFLLRYEGDAMEYFQSDLFDMNNNRAQGHRAWEDEHRWTVQGNLDYVLPFSNTGKFEGGYQYHSYLEDGDYSMQFWDPVKQEFYWRDDIYNTFYFQRGIHSVYAIGSESYRNFDFQLGLRGEHTHQVLRSSIEGADRTVNHFEVFPSVHIGYNLPKEQKLLFAYSYRTTRPQLFYMEPYITYRDYYSAEKGNPDIRPEYIHSFELNYKKNIDEHIISSSLFYRFRKDKIERLRVPYEAGVTLDSMANVGNDRALGVELNGQIKVNRWWNMNLNGNIYYYKVENEFKVNGKNETSTNYDITLNNLFDIHKDTRIQIDGNFVGPTVNTQGRSHSFWFVNLAVRQQLFNRKLQSTLSFRDILNTARYKSDISMANLESITHIRPKYPVITLTLSYTFNNFKKKSDSSRDNRDLFEGTNH